jgi:hypothetical protein
MNNITHGSLFSGIGGFDIAAKWVGWENIFNCEINEFCRKILKYHFPNAEQYKDITKTDFSKWNGQIDVLSGGFLIFKWNETDIKVSEILKLTSEKPIFGNISGKRSNTHCICFMKN